MNAVSITPIQGVCSFSFWVVFRRCVGVIGALLIAIPVQAAPLYADIVAFGDSTTAPGFTNGPTWAETLAGDMGLSLDNQAFGGARTTHILGQANAYIEDAGGNIDPNSLYTLWGGGNDILRGYAGGAANMGLAATNLANAGAAHILILNLYDYGLLPEGTAALSSASQVFNAELAVEVTALRNSLSATIISVDIYALVNDIALQPAAYNLTNVIESCYSNPGLGGTGDQCSNPDEYLWWDDNHPTTSGHDIFAAAAVESLNAAAVPVPATLWLFGSALGILGWMRRKAA